jgi:osmotically inducible protein OsmC
MADRKATAVWNGGIMDGKGKVALGSGLFAGAYSFATRMGEDPGTNPEELLGASLAGCYAMALNATLERGGTLPRQVDVSANVHLGKDDSGFVIKGIDLIVKVDVDGIENDAFQTIAEEVKSACPISKALGGTKISLTATLVR